MFVLNQRVKTNHKAPNRHWMESYYNEIGFIQKIEERISYSTDRIRTLYTVVFPQIRYTEDFQEYELISAENLKKVNPTYGRIKELLNV